VRELSESKREVGKVEWKALDSRVIVVAVEGGVGDWSCYVGAVAGKNHEIEFMEVAKHGSKLPRRIAELLFPEWKERFAWRE
jgi:hypothetical protein